MNDSQEEIEGFECSECGADMKQDTKECPKCGTKFSDEKINSDSKKKGSFSGKLLGMIITAAIILVSVTVSEFIKYCSESESIKFANFDDWKLVRLNDVGIVLKSPSDLVEENTGNQYEGMKSVLYTGGISGFEIVVIGSRIEYGYSYDLERGIKGSMRSLESDLNLVNMNYTISSWNHLNFDNRVVMGQYILKGVKGDLVSLFGLTENKMFSVLIMIAPSNQRALDLGHLMLSSVKFN